MPPWEKYQSAPTAEGPWSKYGQTDAAPVEPQASMGDVVAGLPITRLAVGAASPLIAAAQIGAHVGDKINEMTGTPAIVSPWIDKKLAEYDEAKKRGMKASGHEGFDWMGLIGNLAPAGAIANATTKALPAATSLGTRMLAGGAAGAATGAAQPVVGGDAFFTDKAKQTGAGAAVGAAVPLAGEAIRSAAGNVKMGPQAAQTLKEGQPEGYVIPPSSVNQSWLNNRIESIAGKAAVGQEAAKRNQDVTNALASRAVGLPPNVPMSDVALRDARKESGQVYDEVSKLTPPENMEWFPRFHQRDLVDQLKVVREKITDAYARMRNGDSSARDAAETLKATADSLNTDIANVAKANGREDLVKALTDARVRIAKVHDVENALNLGDFNVSAPIIGRQLDKAGLAAKSGELSLIGRMAEAFPQAMREGGRVPAPGVSGTDAAASALLGTVGYGAGGPAGIAAAGLPLLREPVRKMVMSPGYQNFMTNPEVAPRYKAMIDALMQQGSAGAGVVAGRAVNERK